jgi:SAM-dependent methyltransferase
MDPLLPDRLKALWRRVERGELTHDAFTAQQAQLLDECRRVWADALRLEGYQDLGESLLAELGAYLGGPDVAEIERRCRSAVADLKREWDTRVRPDSRASIERFYDESHTPLYELTWWHTLVDDPSPLAYVLALDHARRHGCRRYLDFGAGVGSGAILFARHGLEVAVADISSPLRAFVRWRLERRGLRAEEFDLRTATLPRERFDMITAMDVFEHLADPVETVHRLWDALRLGGLLFARFGCEPDETHPMHIVDDFEPTLARLRELGGVELWRDDWLWGHQLFGKTSAPRPGALR